jgi:hypothetical protein
MKFIAQYFRLTFFVLVLIYSLLNMSPKDVDIFTASLGYGLVTTLLSVSVLAVYHDEKSTKAFILKGLSISFAGIAIFAIIIVFTSDHGFRFDKLPTWLKGSIRMPPSLAMLLSCFALEKVWQTNETSPKTVAHPYSEFSEQLRANSSQTLPTYEISTLLPIGGSEDKIVMLKYITSFNNVIRCKSDGTIVWQAELPTPSNDVITNIEWKDHSLVAYSRSCMAVTLDVETGKILPTKGTLRQAAA